MDRVRNWIETCFSGMVRSLGLHRMEARFYWVFIIQERVTENGKSKVVPQERRIIL